MKHLRRLWSCILACRLSVSVSKKTRLSKFQLAYSFKQVAQNLSYNLIFYCLVIGFFQGLFVICIKYNKNKIMKNRSNKANIHFNNKHNIPFLLDLLLSFTTHTANWNYFRKLKRKLRIEQIIFKRLAN